MKKILLFFMFAFFLISFVSATQPTVTVPTDSIGINIEHPLSSYFPVNTTHKFHFHLFNVTDGREIRATSATTCSFHLYSPNGSHIYKNNYKVSSDDVLDYEQLLTGSNFSYPGNYAFVFQCNQSTIGGYYTHDFEVTPNGKIQTETTTTVIGRAVWFLFIISAILFIAFLFVPSNPTVKWTFFIVSMMFFLQAVSILYTGMLDEVVNPKIEGYFSFLAASSFILFWFAFGILAVLWIVTTFQTILFNKKQKDAAKYG
jgi:hypothetical protein